MSSVDDLRVTALRLERREQMREGGTIRQARAQVARRAHVGTGTWENLVRRRIKRVDVWLRDRVTDLLVRDLEREITGLENELAMVRASGSRNPFDQVEQIEAHLSAARILIGEARCGGNMDDRADRGGQDPMG